MYFSKWREAKKCLKCKKYTENKPCSYCKNPFTSDILIRQATPTLWEAILLKKQAHTQEQEVHR